MAGTEHSGHRLRMVKRLQREFLQEHELLEMLLFTALPRRNTNDLAHRLLARFGSMSGVLSAELEDLMKVEGVGMNVATHIMVVGAVFRAQMNLERLGHVGQFNSREFSAFIKDKYAKLDKEVLDVYLIDTKSGISQCKRFTSNDKERVKIDPTDFSKLFLDKKTVGVVLVHNHPNGKAERSSADDQMTKQCQLLCSYHNMLLCDHFIYAPDGVYSYYLDGKLAEISAEYSVQALLKNERREIWYE